MTLSLSILLLLLFFYEFCCDILQSRILTNTFYTRKHTVNNILHSKGLFIIPDYKKVGGFLFVSFLPAPSFKFHNFRVGEPIFKTLFYLTGSTSHVVPHVLVAFVKFNWFVCFEAGINFTLYSISIKLYTTKM